jgi:hypothetical protein
MTNFDEIRRMRAQELVTVSNIVQINIFPCISETYEKSTQADLEDFIDAKIVDATQTLHRRTRSESVPPPPSKFSSGFIASTPHSPPPSSSIDAPSSPVRQRAPSFTETETEPSSSQEPKKNLTSDEIHSLLVSCLLCLSALSAPLSALSHTSSCSCSRPTIHSNHL